MRSSEGTMNDVGASKRGRGALRAATALAVAAATAAACLDWTTGPRPASPDDASAPDDVSSAEDAAPTPSDGGVDRDAETDAGEDAFPCSREGGVSCAWGRVCCGEENQGFTCVDDLDACAQPVRAACTTTSQCEDRALGRCCLEGPGAFGAAIAACAGDCSGSIVCTTPAECGDAGTKCEVLGTQTPTPYPVCRP